MRTLLLLPLLVLVLLSGFTEPAAGPWAGVWRLALPGGRQTVLLCGENYLMAAAYTDSAYTGTWGGAITPGPDGAELLLEFCPADTLLIGQRFHLTLQHGQLHIREKLPYAEAPFQRLSPVQGPLTGQWRITERANNDGNLAPMDRTSPRKTIKLLVGNRFQWAAINPAVRGFYGTGGGTYSLSNGQYTETIAFFSRDNRRVGASLPFSVSLTGGRWEQRGQSSAGQPIHEIWTKQ